MRPSSFDGAVGSRHPVLPAICVIPADSSSLRDLKNTAISAEYFRFHKPAICGNVVYYIDNYRRYSPKIFKSVNHATCQ